MVQNLINVVYKATSVKIPEDVPRWKIPRVILAQIDIKKKIKKERKRDGRNFEQGIPG